MCEAGHCLQCCIAAPRRFAAPKRRQTPANPGIAFARRSGSASAFAFGGEHRESHMIPRERAAYSAIIDRPPLKLPNRSRLVVWTIVNLEFWDIARRSEEHTSELQSPP